MNAELHTALSRSVAIARQEDRLRLRQTKAIEDARLVLQLIAEGCKAEGVNDRYVIVENPDYRPDNGEGPLLVFDVATLYPEPEEGGA